MKRPDLSKLSKEEKLQLLDLLEEKDRRARAEKPAYKPNSGQVLVHQSRAKERWVFAGNGSGKTALAAQEALWWAKGHNPISGEFSKVPARIVVLLDHPEKANDVYVPEFTKWTDLRPDQLKQLGKPYVSQIIFDNGSEIKFLSHSMDPLVFESLEIDYIIMDEPPPRSVFVALYRGLRKKGTRPRVLCVGTPITAAWLRKEIYEPWAKGERPNTECFRFGTKVNEKNLADNYIEEFGAVLSERERRIRFEGEFFDLEGLALSHLFDRDIHIIDPIEVPEEWPCVVAVDPHPSKAHHACLLTCDRDGNLYYVKELKRKLVAREFARELRDFYRGFRVVDIVSDSLGSSETSGGEGFKSFIQVLNEEGVRIRATNWDEKNDEDFISRIQEALVIPKEPNNFGQCLPKLRIFRGCTGIISDIENVQWVKYRDHDEFKPKLDITNKDHLSTLKYALATNLSPMKDKAKAYRRIHGAETYGISKKPSIRTFRRKFGTKRR